MGIHFDLQDCDEDSIISIGGQLYRSGIFEHSVRDAFEYFLDMGNVLSSVLKHRGIEVEPSDLVEDWDARWWFSRGVPCSMLRPNESWQAGRIRVKVSVEFVPDDVQVVGVLESVEQRLERIPSPLVKFRAYIQHEQAPEDVPTSTGMELTHE